jgi:ABC-type Fe3+ transport system permease subunit
MRKYFLLPARIWMAIFFAAPLGIVCAYSFLTRGDYGGVEQPWTFESFTRLADPLYLAILWRSVWIASLATVLCALLTGRAAQESISATRSAAVLDQFPGSHLCLAFHSSRHGAHQYSAFAPAVHRRASAIAL